MSKRAFVSKEADIDSYVIASYSLQAAVGVAVLSAERWELRTHFETMIKKLKWEIADD